MRTELASIEFRDFVFEAALCRRHAHGIRAVGRVDGRLGRLGPSQLVVLGRLLGIRDLLVSDGDGRPWQCGDRALEESVPWFLPSFVLGPYQTTLFRVLDGVHGTVHLALCDLCLHSLQY